MSPRRERPDTTAQLCLLVLFIVWVGVGAGVVTGRSPANPEYLHTLIPDQLRCLWWLIPPVFVLWTSATGRLSTLTLVLLAVGPLIRIGSLAWAWLSAYVPGIPAGDPGAWYPILFHVSMLGLVVLAARLIRPRGPLGGGEG